MKRWNTDRTVSRMSEALRGAKLVRGLSRRAPELKALPTDALERAVERCEVAAGFWTALDLWGRERDPLFTKLTRTLRRWIRVDTLLGRLEAHNRRVAEKRAALATETGRAELMEALGGLAAMERWERAWEAAEAGGPERDADEENLGKPVVKPAPVRMAKPVHPEWYRRQKAGLAWRFRLAGVPKQGCARERGMRRRRLDPGLRRDERRLREPRIAVWPEEVGYGTPARPAASRPARKPQEFGKARFHPRPTRFTPLKRAWETSSALQSGRASFGSPNGAYDRLFPP